MKIIKSLFSIFINNGFFVKIMVILFILILIHSIYKFITKYKSKNAILVKFLEINKCEIYYEEIFGKDKQNILKYFDKKEKLPNFIKKIIRYNLNKKRIIYLKDIAFIENYEKDDVLYKDIMKKLKNFENNPINVKFYKNMKVNRFKNNKLEKIDDYILKGLEYIENYSINIKYYNFYDVNIIDGENKYNLSDKIINEYKGIPINKKKWKKDESVKTKKDLKEKEIINENLESITPIEKITEDLEMLERDGE